MGTTFALRRHVATTHVDVPGFNVKETSSSYDTNDEGLNDVKTQHDRTRRVHKGKNKRNKNDRKRRADANIGTNDDRRARDQVNERHHRRNDGDDDEGDNGRGRPAIAAPTVRLAIMAP